MTAADNAAPPPRAIVFDPAARDELALVGQAFLPAIGPGIPGPILLRNVLNTGYRIQGRQECLPHKMCLHRRVSHHVLRTLSTTSSSIHSGIATRRHSSA